MSTYLEFTLILFTGSLAAGLIGALTGLGGGAIIVPLLTLGFKVNIHYAIGASLVSVIGTSSGAAAAFVKEGYSSIRIGMFLEMATTFGAIVGAYIAGFLSPAVIAVIFGCVLIYTSFSSVAEPRISSHAKQSKMAERMKMNSEYPTSEGMQPYKVYNLFGGFSLMGVAGILSGLLGIGSGVVKVIAMDKVMKIPFKVSTATSNFMIGVTAAASAGIYLHRGYIDPPLVMPVMLGALAGSVIGARYMVRAKVKVLRYVFAAIILFLAVQMIYNGITHKLQVDKSSKWTDEYMELLISKLLRRGVIITSFIVCIGAAIFLYKEGGVKPNYGAFKGEPAKFKNIFQILASTLVPSGRGIIETGVLLLISIPVLRVAVSVVSFAKEKDRTYVLVTLVVLFFLLFSLFWQR